MSDIKLGVLIEDDDQKRDALHMAVVPAKAYVVLKPGQRVSLTNYCEAKPAVEVYGGGDDAVGIVDPFLKAPVEEDEQFWVIMLPGSITKLRHSWQHPNLPDEDRYAEYDECRGCH